MAKKQKKRLGWLWFLLSMIVYAVAFLLATKYGLEKFWDFMAAYEVSRPQKPIEAYMEQLTPEHISSLSTELIAQIDHNIQSEEQCRAIIEDAVSGNISYARNLKECTDDRTVYMLMCGGKTIGKVITTAQPADEYGFRVWEVAEESFDLSFLIGEKITLTAPNSYPVLINGVALDESYIIDETRYELLADFYEQYQLPSVVTYEAGPFLGQPDACITDPNGSIVVFGEDTDWDIFIDNCTDEEKQELNTFLDAYITRYVAFTSSSEYRLTNYYNLIEYMVPKGDLADRMYRALDGLQYVKVDRATIVSITTNHLVALGNDRYLCDATYVVDTLKAGEVTRTTQNVKIILRDMTGGLKAESMLFY